MKRNLDVLESMREIAGDLGQEKTDETIHEYHRPNNVDCSHRNHCGSYNFSASDFWLEKIDLYPNVCCSIPYSC